MKHDVQQEIELRRYLLGEMSLEEQVLIEQRLFFDSEYAELEQAVEDDLIDDYLHDDLLSSEREKFETHFLERPEHRDNLTLAAALKTHLDSRTVDPPVSGQVVWSAPAINDPLTGAGETVPESKVTRFSSIVWKKRIALLLPIAALLIFSILLWTAFRSNRGPAANAPLQATDQQPAQTQPDEKQTVPVTNNSNAGETAQQGNANERPDNRPENSSKSVERSVPRTQVATFVVTAGGSPRGSGSTKKITIEADTREVVLQLPLEFSESYERYRAVLLSGERTIDQWNDLKSQQDEVWGTIVSIGIHVDRLREQSYRIRVRGIPNDQQPAEPAVTYPFSVERKQSPPGAR